MNEGEAYFTKQEEEISNKYMSANGAPAEKPRKGSNPLGTLIVGLIIVGGLAYFVNKALNAGKGIQRRN